MSTPGNSINESTTGICGFTGTAFVGTAVTAHNVILGGATSSTLANVAPSATSGIPLVSQGASTNPSFTTAVVAGGGTGNTTFTAFSLIAAGTTATGVFQNVVGVGSAGNILRSAGAAALPAWTTSTYPATNAINTLLYASAANVMSALATANNGVLITSATGVPSLLAAGTTGQVLTATTGSPASWAAIPAVSANKASYKINAGSIASVTGDGTTYTIIWDSQDALSGITYNSGTGVFTVPSSGLYQVVANVTISGLAAANTSALLRIDTSTLAYYSLLNPFVISTSYVPLSLTNGCTLFISRCLQVAANETIKISVYVGGVSKVVSVQGQGAGGNYESWTSIVQLST